MRIYKTFLLFFFITITPFHTQAEEISDPLEPVNRAIFWVNDQLDIYLVEPIARGYDWLLPSFVKTGIGNFFSNLRYPQYLVSDLVQLKFDQVGMHTGRFMWNSTFGLGGFIDVAEKFGVPPHQEDFGIALAHHGVPAGPYIVIPLLGPSNARDAFGRIVDSFLTPSYAINLSDIDSSTSLAISSSARLLEAIDDRARLLDAVEALKEASFDYYLGSQSAYYQYRRGVLYDGNPPEEDFEDEDFEDDVEDE